jgi:hypothetical protein
MPPQSDSSGPATRSDQRFEARPYQTGALAGTDGTTTGGAQARGGYQMVQSAVIKLSKPIRGQS